MSRRSSKARRHPKVRPQGIIELTGQGFGFVKTAEGEFFVPASKVNGAFPGDLVEVARMTSDRPDVPLGQRKPAARVVKVLMRANDTVIGRYEVAEPFGVVVPENPAIPYDIFTLRRDSPEVRDGDIVEVKLIEFPSRSSAATGRVVRVVGAQDDSSVSIDLIIAEHQFETEFSEGARAEAEACGLDIESALRAGYRDIRSSFIFTIDPHDARDFDDAVSLEREGEFLKIGVHIADVSRYVPFASSLDLDARRRSTSVYLVDRVLPMLPEHLSNDLCSLRPASARCAMSVEAVVRRDGSVVSYEVFPSVIESKARLSYDQVQVLLDSADVERALEAFSRCEPPVDSVSLSTGVIKEVRRRVIALDGLAKSFAARRRADGCMDFDRVEAKATLDEDGRCIGVTYRRRTDATALIEEAMILANHLVAQWLVGKGSPCVYRVHDQPDSDALRDLYEVLQEFEMFRDVDKRLFVSGSPVVLQEVLDRARGTSQQEIVNALLLRSMKRAVYRVEPGSHYGLALDTYCHFTSPIRRYPDLLIHRLVKEIVFGRGATSEAMRHSLSWMAEHASTMERRAEKAARQSQLTKIIEYLEDFVGCEFDGVVSQVSTFGVKVKLSNTASGTIGIERLGEDYFAFDPDRQLLRGVDTGIVYRIGQPLKVVLLAAYPRERRLRFRLADGPDEPNDSAGVWDGRRWIGR